jgi:hypothetical protein
MNLYANSADELLSGILEKEHNRGYGLIINLSKLEEQHRTPESFSIAHSMMRNRLKAASGDIFSLPRGDVVVIYDGSNKQVLEETVKELRYLYADDPLAYTQGGGANDNFSHCFSLAQDWSSFASACQEKMILAETVELADGHIIPTLVHYVEKILEQVNFSHVIRSNYIHEKHGDSGYKKYLQELLIDNWQLEMQIEQPTDLFDNRHLCAFMRKFLDVRLLIKLLNSRVQLEDSIDGFFLQLSADTVCSEEFELFDSALSENEQAKIIIAIAADEIYRRDGLWQQAQDILQKKGYRVCVDMVSMHSFLYLDLKAIGADLVRIAWDQSAVSDTKLLAELRAKIQVTGTSRIIMQNCNGQEAMDLCRDIGIGLFSGSSFSYS